ncbi:glycosyltransferase [Thermococcus sp. M39]|uniref:glycosyltransferase n=1 Tax=Thermococcus sp. M39 TaxID=1638262 RepID=UPI00143A9F8C|nr:glycosyltransferase [Thermococcus sp. M39]NJE06964.1 glycosyltransferase [Thermococcus sp. M39]
MKVFLISPSTEILSNPKGGGGTRVHNLAQEILKFVDNAVILVSDIFYNEEKGKLGEFPNVSTLKFFKTKFLGTTIGREFLDMNLSYLITLSKLLKSENPDIIQISFPYGIFSAKLLLNIFNKKNTKVIYDAHNVEAEVAESMLKSSNNLKEVIAHYLGKFFEVFAVRFADYIICTNSKDKKKFVKRYKVNPEKVFVIPSGVHVFKKSSEIEKKDPKCINIIFHGSFLYSFNKEALYYILTYIAPKFEKLKNVKFLIAGSGISKNKKKNIIALGYVTDLRAFLVTAHIAIVPLVHGSGTRLKILDYMSVGLPIVTTKKGIEGIEAINGKHAIIVEGVNEKFIEALEYLIENPKIRKKLGYNARKLAEKKYNWGKIGEQFQNYIKNLVIH